MKRPKRPALALPALALCLALALTACDGTAAPAPAPTPAAEPTAPVSEATPAPAALPGTDPSGAAVTIPQNVETIVTLAPSLTQTVVDLGLGESIVGCDFDSAGLDGVPAGIASFDIGSPDVEALMALAPDVLLVTNLTLYDQSAPYQPLIDAGICVLCVPTAQSIAEVKSDIAFLAAALGAAARGDEIVADLDAELDAIAATAATIPEEERKTVYFEISAAPYLYSTGVGTYLDEMIALIGAKNILADQDGWVSVEAETVVAADPDVILTNVNYIDDPVGEILARDGWAGLAAVRGQQVYTVDNQASSAPNEYITTALWQMAQAVYPTAFAEAPAA